MTINSFALWEKVVEEKRKFDKFDIDLLQTDVTIAVVDVLLRRIAACMGVVRLTYEPRTMKSNSYVWRASAAFWIHEGKTPAAAVRNLARWCQRYIRNPEISERRPAR
jgi:hypothetical protein